MNDPFTLVLNIAFFKHVGASNNRVTLHEPDDIGHLIHLQVKKGYVSVITLSGSHDSALALSHRLASNKCTIITHQTFHYRVCFTTYMLEQKQMLQFVKNKVALL